MVGSVLSVIWSVVSPVAQVFAGVLAVAIQVVAAAFGALSPVLSAIGNVFSTVASGIQGAWGNVSGFFSNVCNAIKSAFQGLSQAASSIFQGISSTVGGIVNGLGQTLSGAWNSIKTVASNAFNALKSIIGDKMSGAANVVRNVVNTIKGAFNFHWSLPPLKLPHISVSGGEAPFGIGGKGSLPQFHIAWYAKGGIVDGATLIGAGESGPEMILPRSGGIMEDFADKVTERSYVSGELVVRWLESYLGPTISEYAPTATPREFGRMVRSYV